MPARKKTAAAEASAEQKLEAPAEKKKRSAAKKPTEVGADAAPKAPARKRTPAKKKAVPAESAAPATLSATAEPAAPVSGPSFTVTDEIEQISVDEIPAFGVSEHTAPIQLPEDAAAVQSEAEEDLSDGE